ncbi:MAG: hypothetical protein AB7G37_01135 [Solirubrobacteraceae bacterium]
MVLGVLAAALVVTGPVTPAAAAAARLSVDAERRGDAARLVVKGRAARSAGRTTVRVTSVPAGMVCAVPTLTAGGRLVGSAGGVGWRALSPLRAGSTLAAGRAFSMTGDAALPTDAASVVCVHLVTVSDRPRVLATRAAELPSRMTGALSPFVGEGAAPIVAPVLRVLLPAVVAILAALGLGAAVRRTRRRRRSRAARAARPPRRPSTGHRTASHRASGDGRTAGDASTRRRAVTFDSRHLLRRSDLDDEALPALPDDVVVPDVVPSSLIVDASRADGEAPPPPAWIVEARDRAGRPRSGAGSSGDARRRRIGSNALGRMAVRAVRRATADLGAEVDHVVVPRGGDDGFRHARVVVARSGRLAFLLVPVAVAPTAADVARAGRFAAVVRDRDLNGLAPMPVLVHHGDGTDAVSRGTAPDFPAHAVWSVPSAGLIRFVRARTPRRQSRRAHSPHGA